MDTKLAKELEELLPEIAKDIIQKNENLPDEYREKFYQNPDSVEEHEPNWHQWGIITHSRKFGEMYDQEIPVFLKNWGLEQAVNGYLQQEIEGVPKGNLIRVSMPLHDLGKFRKGIKEKNGKTTYDFDNHEKISQEIIMSLGFREMLRDYGLTETHIEYVAKCAGNHYELGFVREKAKKSDSGYTMGFMKSPQFLETVNSQLGQFKGFEPEVGLLFLADSMAKTDVAILAETDAQIEQYSSKAVQEIKQRQLHSELIKAVKQRPVNIAAGREYLGMIFK
jgi:hypothetical protein